MLSEAANQRNVGVVSGAAQDNPLERLPLEQTALAMVFKLVEDAQKSWRRLDHPT